MARSRSRLWCGMQGCVAVEARGERREERGALDKTGRDGTGRDVTMRGLAEGASGEKRKESDSDGGCDPIDTDRPIDR